VSDYEKKLPEHDPLCPFFHDTEWTRWMVNEGPRVRWTHGIENYFADEDSDEDSCPWCAFVQMVRDDERSQHVYD
jgi:hypothetical protein